MRTYEGVRLPNQEGTRVVVREDNKTVAVTAPFRTWEEAEEWEREQDENKS